MFENLYSCFKRNLARNCTSLYVFILMFLNEIEFTLRRIRIPFDFAASAANAFLSHKTVADKFIPANLKLNCELKK